MDNLLEILVPLIFAAIYFFGNMLSGKSEGEDAPSRQPRRRERRQEDPEAAERQRRIQEEIRRKIMERRQASESSGPPPLTPADRKLRERQETAAARRETREVQKQTPEHVHETAEASPPPFAAPTHQRVEEPEPLVFSWDDAGNAYGDQMQERLRQIEATKQKAEQLKRQADATSKRSEAATAKKSSTRGGRYFSGSVRDSFRDPAAARAAFVYAEVLGQPISLRKDSSAVPGMN